MIGSLKSRVESSTVNPKRSRSITLQILTAPLFMLLLLVFQLGPAWAQPTFTLGSGSGEQGEAVNLPLVFTNNGDVVGFQADIVFDSNALASGTLSRGGALSSHSLNGYETSPGRFRIVVSPPLSDPLYPVVDGTILTLSFEIDPDALPGDYDIELTGIVLSNASASAVALEGHGDGVVTVTGDGGGTPIPAVTGSGMALLMSVIAGISIYTILRKRHFWELR